jgi:hypothetical protein
MCSVDEVIGDGFDAVRIPQVVRGALQTGDDSGELLPGGDELRRAVLFELFEVAAALAAAVEEDDERPFFLRLGLVTFGFAQEVAVIDFDDEIAAEVLRDLGISEGKRSG